MTTTIIKLDVSGGTTMQIYLILVLSLNLGCWASRYPYHDRRGRYYCPPIREPICASNGLNYIYFENQCHLDVRNYQEKRLGRQEYIVCPVSRCYPKCKTCPHIDDPVCVIDDRTQQLKEFKNPCEVEFVACSFKKYYRFLNYGLCPKENECSSYRCTQDYRPICVNSKSLHREFSNDCELQRSLCENTMNWQTVQPGPCSGNRSQHPENGEEYLEPICASYKNENRTFQSHDHLQTEMEKTGKYWSILHTGYCQDQRSCRGEIIKPICAQLNNTIIKTFLSPCHLQEEKTTTGQNWVILYQGLCRTATTSTIEAFTEVETSTEAFSSDLVVEKFTKERTATVTGVENGSWPVTPTPKSALETKNSDTDNVETALEETNLVQEDNTTTTETNKSLSDGSNGNKTGTTESTLDNPNSTSINTTKQDTKFEVGILSDAVNPDDGKEQEVINGTLTNQTGSNERSLENITPKQQPVNAEINLSNTGTPKPGTSNATVGNSDQGTINQNPNTSGPPRNNTVPNQRANNESAVSFGDAVVVSEPTDQSADPSKIPVDIGRLRIIFEIPPTLPFPEITTTDQSLGSEVVNVEEATQKQEIVTDPIDNNPGSESEVSNTTNQVTGQEFKLNSENKNSPPFGREEKLNLAFEILKKLVLLDDALGTSNTNIPEIGSTTSESLGGDKTAVQQDDNSNFVMTIENKSDANESSSSSSDFSSDGNPNSTTNSGNNGTLSTGSSNNSGTSGNIESTTTSGNGSPNKEGENDNSEDTTAVHASSTEENEIDANADSDAGVTNQVPPHSGSPNASNTGQNVELDVKNSAVKSEDEFRTGANNGNSFDQDVMQRIPSKWLDKFSLALKLLQELRPWRKFLNQNNSNNLEDNETLNHGNINGNSTASEPPISNHNQGEGVANDIQTSTGNPIETATLNQGLPSEDTNSFDNLAINGTLNQGQINRNDSNSKEAATTEIATTLEPSGNNDILNQGVSENTRNSGSTAQGIETINPTTTEMNIDNLVTPLNQNENLSLLQENTTAGQSTAADGIETSSREPDFPQENTTISTTLNHTADIENTTAFPNSLDNFGISDSINDSLNLDGVTESTVGNQDETTENLENSEPLLDVGFLSDAVSPDNTSTNTPDTDDNKTSSSQGSSRTASVQPEPGNSKSLKTAPRSNSMHRVIYNGAVYTAPASYSPTFNFITLPNENVLFSSVYNGTKYSYPINPHIVGHMPTRSSPGSTTYTGHSHTAPQSVPSTNSYQHPKTNEQIAQPYKPPSHETVLPYHSPSEYPSTNNYYSDTQLSVATATYDGNSQEVHYDSNRRQIPYMPLHQLPTGIYPEYLPYSAPVDHSSISSTSSISAFSVPHHFSPDYHQELEDDYRLAVLYTK